MHPILFQIGSFYFYTHGMLAVLGIVLGAFLTYSLAKKRGLNTDNFFDNIVFTSLAGIIGARIAYFLFYPDQFQNIAQIFFLWEGGLISFGGFIVGGIVFALLIKKQKQDVWEWLDLMTGGFFIGLAVGRLGDIMAGEYAGIATTSRYLSIIKNGGVVMVPFFEALLCLLITAVFFILARKFDKYAKGILFSISIALYTLGRFLIDFWRDDDKIMIHLSIGQIVSLMFFIFSLIAIIWLRRRSRHENG